ncbi:MAG TPA: helix-turn-helix transcriptional regulator [Bdellovibrionota bacterium]|nr:helix-turn-helix transcriptional regulator [Bdellovibrionota bacterium]
MTPGARLKILRKARGLSQADYGKRLGLDQSALSRTENGKQELSLAVALKAGLVVWAQDPSKKFVNPFRIAKDADVAAGRVRR